MWPNPAELQCLQDARLYRHGHLFYVALEQAFHLRSDCARDAKILEEEQLNQLLNLFFANLPNLLTEMPETVCMK